MSLAGCEKGVVSGVEKAIGTMSVKEVARFVVKSEYAYGEEGNAELGIPGGAELTYEVQLNNFTKASEKGCCSSLGRLVLLSDCPSFPLHCVGWRGGSL